MAASAYTDEELKAHYRCIKNKREALQVIADMAVCRPRDVAERLGLEQPKKRRKHGGDAGMGTKTTYDWAAIDRELLAGAPYYEVKEKHGFRSNTFWTRHGNAGYREFMESKGCVPVWKGKGGAAAQGKEGRPTSVPGPKAAGKLPSPSDAEEVSPALPAGCHARPPHLWYMKDVQRVMTLMALLRPDDSDGVREEFGCVASEIIYQATARYGRGDGGLAE